METCSQTNCKKTGGISPSYTPRRYCNDHFLSLIEKRIRKDIRKKKLIDTHHTYILPAKKDKETAISRHFLLHIFCGRLTLKTKGSGKIIRPTNLNRECSSFLQTYLENKLEKKEKGIPFLDDVLDEELMHIAKMLKIPAQPEPKHQLIEAIEKKHPGATFALNRSREHGQIRQTIHRQI